MTAPLFRPTLRDASAFFAGEGAVYDAFERVTRRLDLEGLEYAGFGEIALAAHGFKQFTGYVDFVVTDRTLVAIHERLAGSGYSRLGEKRLRDDETGVEIRFIVADLSPCDWVDSNEKRMMRLEKIIELKIMRGLAAAPRGLGDLGDVQKVIAHLNLPLDFAEKLDPFVRDTYIQYWHFHQNATGPDRE